eukprot:3760963-Amphidinium_carterae.1
MTYIQTQQLKLRSVLQVCDNFIMRARQWLVAGMRNQLYEAMLDEDEEVDGDAAVVMWHSKSTAKAYVYCK